MDSIVSTPAFGPELRYLQIEQGVHTSLESMIWKVMQELSTGRGKAYPLMADALHWRGAGRKIHRSIGLPAEALPRGNQLGKDARQPSQRPPLLEFRPPYSGRPVPVGVERNLPPPCMPPTGRGTAQSHAPMPWLTSRFATRASAASSGAVQFAIDS